MLKNLDPSDLDGLSLSEDKKQKVKVVKVVLENIDPSFLAALPADMKKEVLKNAFLDYIQNKTMNKEIVEQQRQEAGASNPEKRVDTVKTGR